MRASAVAFLSLSVGLAPASAVQGSSNVVLMPETSQPMDAQIPSGRSSASAVWSGAHAYLFGGFDGSLSKTILEYDPASDEFHTMVAQFASGRSATSAAWDGDYAYVFGGVNGVLLDEIVRYDPFADSLVTLASKLPTARSETTAVWADGAAYIIGGFGGALLDTIVRFDPASGVVETMHSKLPTGRSGPVAVWGDPYVYIFGGSQDGDQILRFDPAADAIELMEATLPSARYRSAATWDGTFAYVFGGNNGQALNEILRFDPAADALLTLPITLPYARSEAAAVGAGYTSYVFGGCCNGANLLADVVGLVSANAMPIAQFQAGRSGLTVTVDAAQALDPDGAIVDYGWNWGDGSPDGSGPQASHTYATGGSKSVLLTITDNRGLHGSVGLGFDLVAPAPALNPSAVPFLTFPYGAPSVAPTTGPSAKTEPAIADAQPADGGIESGGGHAGDAAHARQAPQGLASRVAQALSESWSETPGLWVSLGLMLGSGCAVAAVLLFRLSAKARQAKAPEVPMGESRKPPPKA